MVKEKFDKANKCLLWILGAAGIILTVSQFLQILQVPNDIILELLVFCTSYILISIAIERSTILEDIKNLLKSPRIIFLIDHHKVHQAAAELLEEAQKQQATEVIITHMETRPWPKEYYHFPERQQYKQAKDKLIKSQKTAIRQIFIVPNSEALSNVQTEANQYCGYHNFRIKIFLHQNDMPHIDILAVRNIGAIISFPHSFTPYWDAMGIQVDDPQFADVIFRYFELLWEQDDGFLVFDKGEVRNDEFNKLLEIINQNKQ